MASGSSRRARLIPQSLLSGPESPTEMELRKLPQTSYDSVEIHGHIDNVTWESFLSQDAGFYESDTSTPPTPTLDLKPLSEHSCRFCPFEGKTLKSLTRHVWTVHKNKREFFCPISGCRGNTIGWLREDLRNRHMSTRHRGQWPEKDASSGDKKGSNASTEATRGSTPDPLGGLMLPALDFEDIPFLLDPASRSPQLEGQHRDKYFEDRLRPLKETGDGAQTAIVVEPTLLQSPSSIPPDSAGISNVDGSPIEAAVYKELSKFVRQEGNSANCWRCQVLGCYKVFMTKHYWEKHVRERHMQWLNKLIDELLSRLFGLDPCHSDLSGTATSRNGPSQLADVRALMEAPNDVLPLADGEGLAPSDFHPQLMPSLLNDEGAHFTDSGYVSGAIHKQRVSPPPGDTGTCYSGASKEDPLTSQCYIQELAEDLVSKLGRITKRDWENLSTNLMKHIKAFSIRVGYQSDDTTHRSIMWFIHKYSNRIVTRMESLLFPTENADSDRSRSVCGRGMSVADKFDMWLVMRGEMGPGDEQLFEGVSDLDDDDEISITERYAKLIFSAPPYEWLLASLGKDLRLGLGEFELGPNAETVKERIMALFPSPRISKKSSPPAHEMEFCFVLGAHETLQARSLTNTIVLNGTLHYCQASTQFEYLRQTWPIYGVQLAKILQQAARKHQSKDHPCLSVRLPDKATVRAWTEGRYLKVLVSGSPSTISECGETLAWVNAAFHTQSLSHGRGKYVLPTIHPSTTAASNTSLSKASRCTLGFEIVSHEIDQNGHGWRDTAGPTGAQLSLAAIIRGFPIPRRPESLAGLETTFDMVKQLAGSGTPERHRGRVLVRGSYTVLGLEREVQDIFVWKVLAEAADLTLDSWEDTLAPADESSSAFDLHRLAVGRHIIAPDLINDKESSSVSSKLVANEIKTSNHIGLLPAEDLRVPSRLRLRGLAKKNTDKRTSSLDEHQEDHSTHLSSQSNSQAPWSYGSPHSGSTQRCSAGTTISSEESFDSDMLSLSEMSSECDRFTPNRSSSDILIRVLHRLLGEWRAVVTSHASPSATSNPASSSTGSSIGQASAPSQLAAAQKRKQPSSDDEDGDGDASFNPPGKKPKAQSTPKKPFACPFWKKEPEKYRECFSRKLSRIKAVKQHITRQHTPAFYCQRCLVVFDDLASQRNHVMATPPCLPCPLGKLDGVTNEQQRLLCRKSKRWHTDTQQWFAIWDILFDCLPRPASPFMDFELSQDFSAFVEFCQRRGSAVLAEELETSDIWDSPADNRRQRLLDIVQTGFRSIFAQFGPTRSSASIFVPDIGTSISDSIITTFERGTLASSSSPSAANETLSMLNLDGRSSNPPPLQYPDPGFNWGNTATSGDIAPQESWEVQGGQSNEIPIDEAEVTQAYGDDNLDRDGTTNAVLCDQFFGDGFLLDDNPDSLGF